MWGILSGLFVASLASGIIPVISAEILVVTAAVAVPSGVGWILVAAVATIGQMLTKYLLFALAGWAPSRLPKKATLALERAEERLSKSRGVTGLVFVSAALGWPPFYGVSLAVGALRMRLGLFLFAGTVGRAVRFGALAWLGYRFGPQALDTIRGGFTFFGG